MIYKELVYKNCLIKVSNRFGSVDYSITDLKNSFQIMSGASTAKVSEVIKELKEQITVYREDPVAFLTW